VAIDAESGRELSAKAGRSSCEAYEGASLAVRGTHAVYCADGSRDLSRPQTGVQRWRVPCEPSLSGRTNTGIPVRLMPGTTVSLVLSDDAVYLADINTLSAFAMADGAKLWTAPTHMNHYKAPDCS